MTENETYIVETKVVNCDGNNSTNGHPRVYLNMGDKEEIQCPYCSRLFIFKPKSS